METVLISSIKEEKEVFVDYEIIGKGSLIYHYVKEKKTDWELIGNHYEPGPNLKLFFTNLKKDSIFQRFLYSSIIF